jgi:hypothetical protein
MGPTDESSYTITHKLADFGLICFSFFSASGHQKLLWIAKHLTFQPASITIDLVKVIQNQHEHRIGRVVAIVRIHHFLDPEPYGHLHIPPHAISTILRFSSQLDSPHN